MRTILSAALLLALPTLAMAEPPPPDGAPPAQVDGPPPPSDASPGDGDKILDQVKEKYPEKWEYLMKLRRENPGKFHHSVRQLRRKMMRGLDDPEVRKRMKEMKALQKSFKAQVEAYEAATGKAQDKVRKTLIELASKMFDARQAHRKRRLESAKKHMVELEDEIEERDKKRKELIDRFVEEATTDKLQGL